MEIKTKFNHGHRVQAIVHGTEEYQEKCPVCEGEKVLEVKGIKIGCPGNGCWGNGYVTKQKSLGWFVPKDSYYNFVIQKIGVELYNPKNKEASKNRSWIYYQSLNGGTMFKEDDLFHTIEEAQAECDKRNKEI